MTKEEISELDRKLDAAKKIISKFKVSIEPEPKAPPIPLDMRILGAKFPIRQKHRIRHRARVVPAHAAIECGDRLAATGESRGGKMRAMQGIFAASSRDRSAEKRSSEAKSLDY